MRRILLVSVGTAALLALTSAAFAAADAHVTGAGVRGGSVPTFIAVNAHGNDVSASGDARLQTDSWKASVSVTCIRRAGDLEVVGGLVTDTSSQAGPGWGAVIVIQDGSHGVRDRVGYGFEPPPPATSIDCSVGPAIFPLAPLEHGNFAIK